MRMFDVSTFDLITSEPVATPLLQNQDRVVASTGRPLKRENIDKKYERAHHLLMLQDKQTKCGQCHQKTTIRCRKYDGGGNVRYVIESYFKVVLSTVLQ